MKKVFSLLITLAMLISTAVVPMTASAEADVWDGTVADGFASGTGIENDPYIISSAEELAYLAKSTYEALSTSTAAPVSATVSNTAGIYNAYTGVYFKLTADIDLGNKEWTPIGRQGMRFNGNFDGNGHVVKNMKMTTPYMGMGLFGATGINVKVTKLGIEDANFNYDVYVGRAKDKPGTIDDASYTVYEEPNGDGRVYGTGALVGIFAGGTFEDCYVKDVTINRGPGVSQSNAGGLLGGPYCTNPTTSGNPTTVVTVNRCYVNGFATAGAQITCLGGIAGSAANNTETGKAYGCAVDFDYCYIVNTDFQTGNQKCAMTNTRHSTADAMNVNCYADQRYDENHPAKDSSKTQTVMSWSDYPKLMTNETDWDDQFVATGYWSADNEKAPINDGYPVLAWQNTWLSTWDGTVATGFASGSGAENDPYIISSAEEFAYLASSTYNALSTSSVATVSNTAGIYNAYTGVYFNLTTDIDLANNEWLPIGRLGMRFNGNFDGNGHIIKNLKISNEYYGIGLFGAIGSDAKIAKIGIDTTYFEFEVKDNTVVDRPVSGGDASYTIYSLNYGTDTRVFGAGTLVGLYGGGTIEDCYVRNTEMSVGGTVKGGGLGGLIGAGRGDISRGNNMPTVTTTVKRSYVNGFTVTATGNAGMMESGAFAGSARQNTQGFFYGCNLDVEDCYVTNIDMTILWNAQIFAAPRQTNSTFKNCYTTDVANSAGTPYTHVDASGTTIANGGTPIVTVATKAEIESGLVKGNGAFYLDNVSANINNGYPVLAWQRDWTVATSPASFYKVTAHTAADGAVNSVTVIQSDANVHGTVIVAVYDGTRFVNAVTAEATNGAIPVTGLSAVSGNTIKVFVWDSLEGLTPLAAEYSTTL